MNGFIRKMCIIKQLKSGFSADGTPIGGVVRVESFAGRLTLQISLINFAPVSEGRYVCVLCDRQGERLYFPLLSGVGEYKADNEKFNPEKGFCCLICFIRKEAACIAAGQYGGGVYSMRNLLSGIVCEEEPPISTPPAPPSVPRAPEKTSFVENKATEAPVSEGKEEKYNDELLSEENYYARESSLSSTVEDAESTAKTLGEKSGKGTSENEDDFDGECFPPFKITDGKDYYRMVKDELENLFSKKKRSLELIKTFPHSEWVEVPDANGCLIGKIYENLEVRYIAYALPAKSKTLPEGMEKACYIPVDPLKNSQTEGYYVLFQDVSTGECVQVNMI